jgi:putative transposase
MAAELDEMAASFRYRPLDAGPCTILRINALTQKIREGGRTVNVHALIATSVNADKKREIPSLDIATAEMAQGGWRSCTGWPPAACPASSWSPATARHGLRDAIPAVLPSAA